MPSQAAIGRPVTVNLRNGRVLHGVLGSRTDARAYVLEQTAGTRSVPRSEVDTLVVRER